MIECQVSPPKIHEFYHIIFSCDFRMVSFTSSPPSLTLIRVWLVNRMGRCSTFHTSFRILTLQNSFQSWRGRGMGCWFPTYPLTSTFLQSILLFYLILSTILSSFYVSLIFGISSFTFFFRLKEESPSMYQDFDMRLLEEDNENLRNIRSNLYFLY